MRPKCYVFLINFWLNLQFTTKFSFKYSKDKRLLDTNGLFVLAQFSRMPHGNKDKLEQNELNLFLYFLFICSFIWLSNYFTTSKQ